MFSSSNNVWVLRAHLPVLVFVREAFCVFRTLRSDTCGVWGRWQVNTTKISQWEAWVPYIHLPPLSVRSQIFWMLTVNIKCDVAITTGDRQQCCSRTLDTPKERTLQWVNEWYVYAPDNWPSVTSLRSSCEFCFDVESMQLVGPCE